MTSASLELCKELYELSGWHQTKFYLEDLGGGVSKLIDDQRLQTRWRHGDAAPDAIPAYDLGYLLRKLPNMVKDDDGTTVVTDDASDGMPFSLTHCEDASWVADYQGYLYGHAATPEDAVAKLAIELFKQGILK